MTMTRRSFVASVAMSLVAPRIRLRPSIDREALMLPFCGDFGRFDLKSPFGVGSLTYATDSIRMVRAELSNRHEDGDRRVPDVERVFRDLWHPGEFAPLAQPAVSELRYSTKYATCPECCGRRVSLGDRYPTDEEVRDRYKFRQYDVDDNSIGDVTCGTCHGREYHGPSVVRVGAMFFEFAILKPVWALPGVRVSLCQIARHPCGTPLLFSADGFDGIVCPLHPDYVDGLT